MITARCPVCKFPLQPIVLLGDTVTCKCGQWTLVNCWQWKFVRAPDSVSPEKQPAENQPSMTESETAAVFGLWAKEAGMEEKGFLQVIADSPEDDTTRLVYADWLEERGDLRAEYLRVEYCIRVEGTREMMSRLIQLRTQLDPNWLRAVHDGYLGRSDWALVLQSLGRERKVVIAALRRILHMRESAAETAVQRCPSELQRGLWYWEAHRLRKQFGVEALVTVEFRP